MRRFFVHAVTAALSMHLVAGAVAQHRDHSSSGHRSPEAASAKQTADARVLVNFPPMLADHTLSNMRDHLLALQEISEALAVGANDKAGRIAEERLGMSSLSLHGAHDVAKFMPAGMQEAGTGMHRAASRFAIEAQNAGVTGDLKPALSALGAVMGQCVACHAGYRLK